MLLDDASPPLRKKVSPSGGIEVEETKLVDAVAHVLQAVNKYAAERRRATAHGLGQRVPVTIISETTKNNAQPLNTIKFVSGAGLVDMR